MGLYEKKLQLKNPNSFICPAPFPSSISGIHLQFLNFSTEAIHDYLEIRSGTLEAGSVIDRFSGPLVPKPLFSTTHQTTFFFHSDYSQNKPGFHITYQGARCVPRLHPLMGWKAIASTY